MTIPALWAVTGDTIHNIGQTCVQIQWVNYVTIYCLLVVQIYFSITVNFTPYPALKFAISKSEAVSTVLLAASATTSLVALRVVDEIWKRENHRRFWICVWGKLSQGNHRLSRFWYFVTFRVCTLTMMMCFLIIIFLFVITLQFQFTVVYSFIFFYSLAVTIEINGQICVIQLVLAFQGILVERYHFVL